MHTDVVRLVGTLIATRSARKYMILSETKKELYSLRRILRMVLIVWAQPLCSNMHDGRFAKHMQRLAEESWDSEPRNCSMVSAPGNHCDEGFGMTCSSSSFDLMLNWTWATWRQL